MRFRKTLSSSLTLVIAFLGGRAVGQDPLALIPADVPWVLAFPKPAASAAKLNDFVRSLDPGFPGVDLDEIQRGFNLADGIVDTSAPAYLVLTRSRLDDESAYVLIFKPQGADALVKRFMEAREAILRCDGPEGSCWVMMQNGLACAGTSSRTLRQMRRSAGERSLASVLDGRQKELFTSADVVLHLQLSQMRDRIQPWLLLATNMIRLSSQLRQQQAVAEGSSAVLEWFADGLRTVVNDMESVTLGLTYTGQAFVLTHHHVFAPGKTVSKYLGQVRHRGLDLWGNLPDRPFLAIGAFDWSCPGETSLTGRFNQYMFFSNPSTAKNVDDQKRKRIAQAMSACYDDMWGSQFMATTPEDRLYPLAIFGGYAMADARKGIEHLLFLQENAGDAFSTMIGEQSFGRFEKKEGTGGPYWEMAFHTESMDQSTRDQLFGLYGDDLRIQERVFDDHHIDYVSAGPAFSVSDLLKVRESDRNIGKNPAIREMLDLLPEEPNAVVMLDLGRCFGTVPYLIELARNLNTQGTDAARAKKPGRFTGPNGMYLAWACKVERNSLTGCLAIKSDNVVSVFNMVRELAEDLVGDMGATAEKKRP